MTTFAKFQSRTEGAKPRFSKVQIALFAVLAIDIFFILVETLWGLAAMLDLTGPRAGIFRLGNDFGLPEFFNFAKWLVAAAALLLIAEPVRRWVWLPAAAALLVMLADDSLMIHEAAGRYFAEIFVPETITYSSALGELIFIALFAAVIFGALFLSRARAQGEDRTSANKMILLMLLLGVFGVIVDLIHSIIKFTTDNKMMESLSAILEDGGEMIVITLILFTAIKIARRKTVLN